MGDGGVACMPLQQQHIMERLSNAEKTLCGGKNGNGFNSKLLKFADCERKKKMKVKKEEPAKVQVEKSDLVLDRVDKSKNELENDETSMEKVQKEEVEEGELGTMKWSRNDLENGEFVQEKPRRGEIANGEIVTEKWKKGELEKGEIVSGKWRRDDVEKGEIVPERGRKGEADKGEYGSLRVIKDDIEKGEFIPDRWHRGEVGKDDYGYSRMRRHQSSRDKGWKSERERTSPSGRYAGDDYIRKKEFNRSGSQHVKGAPRWESGQERNIRISSKIVNEEKNEHSNGRNHARDYTSGSRLKRHGNDSDSSDRRHYGDYAGLKSRRLSDDNCRPPYSEHYSHRSGERSYRNSASKISADKYSRNHEPSLPTRSACDRHGRSPGHSERSPRDRTRVYDHRDRTPVRRERSPHGRDRSPYIWEKSPHGRDRSPHIREKSPHGREKSPYERSIDRSRYNDHKIRSPTHAERSPQDRRRHHDRSDRTPNLVERSPFDRPRQNNLRETSSKTISSEKHNSPHSCKDNEDKQIQRESNCSGVELQSERNFPDINESVAKDNCRKPEKEQQSYCPTVRGKESPRTEPPPEELPSMEEDMDICDTPPHVPVAADSSSGKWFYLDYSGVEQGPSKLCDIKVLITEGVLMSDHFVKHLDSDRWLTAENAASPLAAQSFPSIVSDTITQLVSPPEAPGNLLADTGDILQSGPENFQEMPAPFPLQSVFPDDSVGASEPSEELLIDERVEVLLEGYDVTPGRELEAIKGILFC